MAASAVLPLISVIIPVFRRPDYLQQALESVLAQSYPRVEVIVVDDGSGDEWVSRYELPSGVTLIRHRENRGPAASRNTGFAASRGQFIAWLDSDDVWQPGKLEAQAASLLASPSAGLTYCHATMVDEDLAPLAEQPRPREVADAPMRFIARSNFIRSPSCVLARRSIVERANGYDVSLKGAEDWDLWISMARFAPFLCDSRSRVLYRTHPGQRTVFGLHRLEATQAIRWKWLDWAQREAPEHRLVMRKALSRELQRHSSLYLRHGGGALRAFRTVARAVGVYPWDLRNYWRVARLLVASLNPASWKPY